MSFTSLHDLSLAYLLKLLIERQQKTIAACEKLADALSLAPYAQAAAREAVGEAKGHLENLQELQAAMN
jgi:Ni,Fe-hydrogenase maturation factor